MMPDNGGDGGHGVFLCYLVGFMNTGYSLQNGRGQWHGQRHGQWSTYPCPPVKVNEGCNFAMTVGCEVLP